ncbi:MAG: Ig-like domain-containing protein [Cyclobacteriaceae bacterium]
MKKITIITFGTLALWMLALWSHAQTRVTELDAFRTNHAINKMVVDEANDVLYLGGSFTRIGVKRDGVAASLTTADVPADWPEVEGQVNVSISDGNGGFFIGGDFTKVGGENRSDLAHIDASGQLSSWPGQVSGTSSSVSALVLDNGSLYAGGFFTTAFDSQGNESRRSIVKFDASTGDIDSWYPTGGVPSQNVLALEVIGTELYLGGSFNSVGGITRPSLAAVNTSTGAVSSWNPTTNDDVFALKKSASGTSIYVGGFFTSAGGQSRDNFAEISLSTGSATSLDVSFDSRVYDIETSGSDIFVSGQFNTVDGNTRRAIVKMSNAGVVSSWDAGQTTNYIIQDMAINGSTIYFRHKTSSQDPGDIKGVSTSTAALTGWELEVDIDLNETNASGVYSLSISGGDLYVGGRRLVMGGEERNYLAAIDLSNYTLKSWNPDPDGAVHDMELVGSTLYVGGEFTDIDQNTRNHLAALNSSGAALNWNPNVSGDVYTLLAADGQIYFGGSFGLVGGTSRSNIAAVSQSTGSLNSWNPGANSDVTIIEESEDELYIGGSFGVIGGQGRTRLASFSIGSSTPKSWNPAPNFTPKTIHISNDEVVYVGGQFTSISGQSTVQRLAAYDAATLSLSAWDADPSSTVNALASSSAGTVYAAGQFGSIGGQTRIYVAALDPTTSSALDWNIPTGEISRDITDIEVTSDHVFMADLTIPVQYTRANEPPSNILLSKTSFNENTLDALVGTLSATDDAGDTHTYTFVSGTGDTDNASFTVSGSQLNFDGTANFEVKSSYSIRIQATDQNGNSLSKAFAITVVDRPDAPTDIVVTPDDIDENSGANEPVGVLSAEDEDVVDTHVFDFASGKGDDHNSNFSIVGSSLIMKEGLSHEKFAQLSIRLSVEDAGRNVFEKILAITINDLPESPTNISIIDNNIDENEPVGTVVGNLSTTDQDEGDTHTYTLVSGTGDTDNASFTIDGAQLKSAEVFDYETKDTYSIRVQTDDGVSAPFVKVLQIDIDDVDEIGPVLISSVPTHNETAADPPTTIVLSFDEGVFFPSDEVVTLYLDRGTSGAVQTWQVVNGTLPPNISVDGNQITLDIVANFFFGEDYSVRGGYKVEDALGNEATVPQIDFTIRAASVENDILSFTATGLDGAATIDVVNHTITANMLGTAPVFVDPQFTLSDGAVLFGSSPDQWATNVNYWMSGETKTVNVRSESGSTQVWSVTLTWQPLTGIYSVGATGYFLTLSSAFDELELRGIGADVTFELQDGYDEFGAFFIDLDPYLGNDLYTTTVTVEDGATSAHFYYNQIGMDGIQNFVVDGKGVLEVESITNAFFDLDPDTGGNPCGNITLKNLIGFRDPNSTATAFGRLVSADAVDGLVIENNTLSYQEATVINVGVQSINVEVSGNEIRTTDTNSVTAVIVSSTGNTTVVNNTIYVTSPRGTALSVSNSDNAQIHHNTIYADFSTSHQSNAGIYLGASTSTPQVSNNIIQMNGAVRQAGFYVRFILESEVNLSYNNIYMPFENSLENYAEFIEDNVKYGVNQWEAFLANHPNHTNEEAFFTDADNGDLTPTGTSLASGALRGTPLAAVPEDINSDTRSTVGPSKGAYEYANIATDILAFSVPDQGQSATIDPGAHTVEILLSEGSSTTQVPEITTNTGASINPTTGISQDFSSPVVYTVTAEEGNTQDWTVFATELDETAPVIASLSPANNASGVLANISQIVVTFDEPVQSTGFSTDAVIRTVTGNVEAGRIDVSNASVADFNGSTLTMTVPSELDELTNYYVTLPFGAIEDLSGNDFVGYSNNTTWRFTTSDQTAPSPVTFSPVDEATSVSPSANLVLTFDEPVQATGTTLFGRVKRKSDDQILQSFGIHDTGVTTFSGSTMTVDLASSLPELEEVYITIPDGAVEDLEGNVFTGFDDNETWDFTVADVTAPTITTFSPVNGAVKVDNYASIVLTFSEDIQLSGNPNSNIKIKRVSNNAELRSIDPASGQVSIVGNVVTITPTGGILSTEEEVQIYVNWSSTPFEDLAGNDFNDLFSSSDYRFTVDNELPEIVSFSPEDEAVDVAVDGSLVVTFSEPMRTTGITRFLQIRRKSNDDVLQSRGIHDASATVFSGNTMTVSLSGDLPFEEDLYVVLPDGAVEDFSGNVITGFTDSESWDFTTEDFPFLEWNGSEWNNVTGPASNGSDDVVIAGNYSFEANGLLNVRNLTINSGATLNVDTEESLYIVEDLTNNGELIIGSGATLLVFESGTITGNDVKVQRNTRYADGRYSFVGSPVEQNANTTASDLGSFVYTYDESQSATTEDLTRWVAAGASDQLVSGKGYTQANQQLIEFVGVPNTGTVNYAGSYINDGWNLISNPYTASIEVSDFLGANNTTGAIYIWDDNGSNTGRGSNSDYIVANGTMATNTTPAGGQTRYNGYMGVAQGFFVKLMDNSNTTITFNEGMRAGNNNEDEHFFRKASKTPSHVRINLTADDGLFKQAILAWMPDINDSEVDRRFDAAVFSRTADYAVYTLKADQPLAIQGVTYDKEEIPLGFNAKEAGTYQIEIDQSSFEGSMLYLIDKQTEETVDLTQGSYSFYAEAGQFTDRFVLSTVSSILSTEVASSNIYAANKILHIELSGSQSAQYELFNLSGKKVATILTSGQTKVDLGHLPNGIYLVSDGIESKKIVLK